MPFESSLPLVLACLVGTLVALFVWLQVQTRWLIAAAILMAAGGVLAFVADKLVVTDREQLFMLFPRLADAAERRDVATIIAAVDPDVRPLREQIEQALRQVQPTDVVITNIDLSLAPGATPPRAEAEVVVKVTGNIIDRNTPGTVLVEARVSLLKKDGTWLIQNATVEPVRPGHEGDHPHARRE